MSKGSSLLSAKLVQRLLYIVKFIITKPDPEIIKRFSCSTQLSMKFVLLIIFKLLIIAFFSPAEHSWAWIILC